MMLALSPRSIGLAIRILFVLMLIPLAIAAFRKKRRKFYDHRTEKKGRKGSK